MNALHRSRLRGNSSWLIAACLFTIGGCSIRTDQAPRDIDAVQQDELRQTNAALPNDAVGAARVFFVSSDELGQATRLESVARDVGETPVDVVEALLRGPTIRELDGQLRTALPAGTRLLSSRTVNGVLVLDVSPELTQLTGSQLIAAVGQIILTVGQLSGIDEIKLLVDGNPQQWPTASGELKGGPLTSFDFQELVQSIQPAFPAAPTPQQ